MALIYTSTMSAADTETGQTLPLVSAVTPDKIGREADSDNVYALGAVAPSSGGGMSFTKSVSQDRSDKLASTVTSLGTALFQAGGVLGSSFINANVRDKSNPGARIFGMFQPAPPPVPRDTTPSWLLPVAIGGGVIVLVLALGGRSRSSGPAVATNPRRKKGKKKARRGGR